MAAHARNEFCPSWRETCLLLIDIVNLSFQAPARGADPPFSSVATDGEAVSAWARGLLRRVEPCARLSSPDTLVQVDKGQGRDMDDKRARLRPAVWAAVAYIAIM